MKEEVRHLDLADFLLIAEAALSVDAGELAYAPRLAQAESALAAPSASFEGRDFYPAFPDKAAVLCSRLIRNHPLLDGNKRVGYLCLVEFVERNGYSWSPPPGDPPNEDETVETIEKVAAGDIDEPTLARWIEGRITARR